jgi:hypothetical protein
MKTITLKIDEDNDLYEMKIGNEVYTLDNVYKSKYGNLFDELNMAIETEWDSQVWLENRLKENKNE